MKYYAHINGRFIYRIILLNAITYLNFIFDNNNKKKYIYHGNCNCVVFIFDHIFESIYFIDMHLCVCSKPTRD